MSQSGTQKAPRGQNEMEPECRLGKCPLGQHHCMRLEKEQRNKLAEGQRAQRGPQDSAFVSSTFLLRAELLKLQYTPEDLIKVLILVQYA